MYKIIHLFFACVLFMYGFSACGSGGRSDKSNLNVNSVCLYNKDYQSCSLSVNWNKLPKATSYTIEYRSTRNIQWLSRNLNSSYNQDAITSPCQKYEKYDVRVVAEGEFKTENTLSSDIITCDCL
jgi:hypothetical protein